MSILIKIFLSQLCCCSVLHSQHPLTAALVENYPVFAIHPAPAPVFSIQPDVLSTIHQLYHYQRTLYNVSLSIVQRTVFIPILSNIQPLTILSTIQQLFPTKNSFILHNSQANKTPKKQFARRIFKIPFKKK